VCGIRLYQVDEAIITTEANYEEESNPSTSSTSALSSNEDEYEDET
jgi:hypothetical protein